MKKFILPVLLVFCTGCAKLAHMSELLTLKAVGEEVEAMDKIVDETDQKLALLVQAYQDGTIKEFSTKKKVLRKFGKPIQVQPDTDSGLELERWLYRRAVKFFDSEKVYLFFDHDNKLVRWEYVEAPKKEPADALQNAEGGNDGKIEQKDEAETGPEKI